MTSQSAAEFLASMLAAVSAASTSGEKPSLEEVENILNTFLTSHGVNLARPAANDVGTTMSAPQSAEGVPSPPTLVSPANAVAPPGAETTPAPNNHLALGRSSRLQAALTDPLTGALLEDASVLKCGHSFGSASLGRIAESGKCATCQAPVDAASAIPNLALRAAASALKASASPEGRHLAAAASPPIRSESPGGDPRGAKRRRDPVDVATTDAVVRAGARADMAAHAAAMASDRKRAREAGGSGTASAGSKPPSMSMSPPTSVGMPAGTARAFSGKTGGNSGGRPPHAPIGLQPSSDVTGEQLLFEEMAGEDNGDDGSPPLGVGKELKPEFQFAVGDRVLIKGNKRTPEKFVNQEAIVASQCLNGWYQVKTVESGQTVRLQYRSLQKLPRGSSVPASSTGTRVGGAEAARQLSYDDAPGGSKRRSLGREGIPVEDGEEWRDGMAPHAGRRDTRGTSGGQSPGTHGGTAVRHGHARVRAKVHGSDRLEDESGGTTPTTSGFSPSGGEGPTAIPVESGGIFIPEPGLSGGPVPPLSTLPSTTHPHDESLVEIVVTDATKGGLLRGRDERFQGTPHARWNKHGSHGGEDGAAGRVPGGFLKRGKREGMPVRRPDIPSKPDATTSGMGAGEASRSMGPNELLQAIRVDVLRLEAQLPISALHSTWKTRSVEWREEVKDSTTATLLGMRLRDFRNAILLTSAGRISDADFDCELEECERLEAVQGSGFEAMSKRLEAVEGVLFLWERLRNDVKLWIHGRLHKSAPRTSRALRPGAANEGGAVPSASLAGDAMRATPGRSQDRPEEVRVTLSGDLGGAHGNAPKGTIWKAEGGQSVFDMQELYAIVSKEAYTDNISGASLTAAAGLAIADAIAVHNGDVQAMLAMPLRLFSKHSRHELRLIREKLDREKRHISARLAALGNTVSHSVGVKAAVPGKILENRGTHENTPASAPAPFSPPRDNAQNSLRGIDTAIAQQSLQGPAFTPNLTASDTPLTKSVQPSNIAGGSATSPPDLPPVTDYSSAVLLTSSLSPEMDDQPGLSKLLTKQPPPSVVETEARRREIGTENERNGGREEMKEGRDMELAKQAMHGDVRREIQ